MEIFIQNIKLIYLILIHRFNIWQLQKIIENKIENIYRIMEKILTNLKIHEVLHLTSRGTQYLLVNKTIDGGIKYSINKTFKTLPIETIQRALADHINGQYINARWYQNFNSYEYKNRPCNLSVLKSLLKRYEINLSN